MDIKQKLKLAQINKHKDSLFDRSKISLNEILSSKKCQCIISECRNFRKRIYTPITTLFVFIKQVLNSDKSCKNAVAELVAEQLISEGKLVSNNTGSYSDARQRLPEKTVKELVKETGKSSAKKSLVGWKAFGRNLKGVDGTTVIMPDTKANQESFQQIPGQKKGVGFPIARMVVVMSLTTGTILDYAISAYKGKGTGESSLFRSIFDCIEQDDILLGDRYYPSFFLIADVLAKGADGIFRAHARRHYDFRKGQSLGKKDHIVEWKKPRKPEDMSQEIYDSYPEGIKVREFKVNGNIYVTTLLDNKKYNTKELAKTYELRWSLEINLKSIKDVMDMDVLSCKTPEMVRKEIGIHFLAYNFIRIIMAEACSQYNVIPTQVSFKGTVQLLNNFMPYFVTSNSKKNRIMYDELLKCIVKNRVNNRPGRVEPRKVKKRPKPYDVLNKPRFVEKARLERQLKRAILRNAYA
jgi:Transposase DDE domain